MPIRRVKSANKAYKAKKTSKVMKRASRIKGNVDRAVVKRKSAFGTTQRTRNAAKLAIKAKRASRAHKRIANVATGGILATTGAGGYAYGRSKKGRDRTAGKYIGVGLIGGVGGLAGYHAASGRKKKKSSRR